MLIVLLHISLRMIIVFPKGTRAFGELQIGFANYTAQHTSSN